MLPISLFMAPTTSSGDHLHAMGRALLPLLRVLLHVFLAARAPSVAGEAATNARHLNLANNPVETSPAVPTVAQPPPPPRATVHRRRRGGRHHTREFLDSHNSVREYVGVEALAWNSTIARLARRFLNTKRGTCEMVHSDMMDFGENLFWGGGKRWRPSDAVQAWAQEHFYYDPDKNECLPGRICGHYTQLIWRMSKQLGCGRVECTNGGVLISCNYMPAGNFLGESPFQTYP